MENVWLIQWLFVAFVLAITQQVIVDAQSYQERGQFDFGNYRYDDGRSYGYSVPRYQTEHNYYTNSDYGYGEYDVVYPQYSYKPYSECECSRVAYEDYRRYQAEFRYHWYSDEYQEYSAGQEYREEPELYKSAYTAYHNYDPILTGDVTYPAPDESRVVKPGRKCYEFNPNKLRKRKPCPKRPREKRCKKGRVRKEYRQLTKDERESLHKAMNKMKNNFPYMWNTLAQHHIAASSPWAHAGASFLPWHREYLFRFEQELYKNGYKGPGLPYYASSLDQTLPNPSHSAIWTEAYLGNLHGVVNTGPFAGWDSTPSCRHVHPKLYRNGVMGVWGQCLLFSDFDIAYVMSKRCFKDLTCNTDCKFESDHGAVHTYVGGHMGVAPCAPNDPVFYLHHAFIDCIWEEFRQNSQTTNIYTEYPSLWFNGDDIGRPIMSYSVYGFEWFSEMRPFGLRNGHGIGKWYEKYYKCVPRPWKCRRDSDCKGDLLWCHNGRCTGKVRNGGDCNGFPDNACDTTECSSGRAQCRGRRCSCIIDFVTITFPTLDPVTDIVRTVGGK